MNNISITRIWLSFQHLIKHLPNKQIRKCFNNQIKKQCNNQMIPNTLGKKWRISHSKSQKQNLDENNTRQRIKKPHIHRTNNRQPTVEDRNHTRESTSLPFLPRSLVTTTFGLESEAEEARILFKWRSSRLWSRGREVTVAGNGGESERRESGAIGNVLAREKLERQQMTAGQSY